MNTAAFFDSYYRNAELNSLLIMDAEGTIMDVSQSFTKNFGYNNEEIKGQNFSILFTKGDKEKNKPRLELETVVATGQANDENYVIDNQGHAIWCTGESLLVAVQDGKAYIVKDIVNLQEKKQLQLFLLETEVLLERIFESSKEIPIMILDGSMKIKRVNDAFLRLFEITDVPADGDRLSDLHHSFWSNPEIKDELRRIIVSTEPINKREFLLNTRSGEKKTIRLNAKITGSTGKSEKKFFIVPEDIGE